MQLFTTARALLCAGVLAFAGAAQAQFGESAHVEKNRVWQFRSADERIARGNLARIELEVKATSVGNSIVTRSRGK